MAQAKFPKYPAETPEEQQAIDEFCYTLSDEQKALWEEFDLNNDTFERMKGSMSFAEGKKALKEVEDSRLAFWNSVQDDIEGYDKTVGLTIDRTNWTIGITKRERSPIEGLMAALSAGKSGVIPVPAEIGEEIVKRMANGGKCDDPNCEVCNAGEPHQKEEKGEIPADKKHLH